MRGEAVRLTPKISQAVQATHRKNNAGLVCKQSQRQAGRSARSTRATSKASGRGRPLHTSSGGYGVGGDQAAVELQVIVNHAFGGVALAGAVVGAVGVGLAQPAIGLKLAQDRG